MMIRKEEMSKEELVKKVVEKKEFSQLPLKDVEMAFSFYNKEKYTDEEKVKLTRNLLRNVFSSFSGANLFSKKNINSDKILRKHKSTNERLFYYSEIYERIFKGLNGKRVSVIDLGAGVNGYSFPFFEKLNLNVSYIAVEAVGQFVDLMNSYFITNHLNGKAIHLSLFETEKIKKLILETRKPRVVFLFKVIDSLEMLKRDYSKELISELMNEKLADRVVVSYATKSLGRRERFKANRNWIVSFIKDDFKVIDDFEIGGERYLVFEKK